MSESSTCHEAEDDSHDSAMPAAYCTAPAQRIVAAHSSVASIDDPARRPLPGPGATASADSFSCGATSSGDRIDTAMPSACAAVQPEDVAATVERMNPFDGARIVAADQLAETRGGFEMTDQGQTLRVTFGIERAVLVNGNLVSTSTLALDGLNRLVDTGQAGIGTSVRTAGSTANILHNGADNAMSLGAAGLPAGALMLQNSLDNQQLGARTVINAVVENSGLLRATRLESMMRDAAIGAVRR